MTPYNYFLPVRCQPQAAATLMTGPGGIDALTLAGLELIHNIPHSYTNTFDLFTQKGDILRPHEVVIASSYEIDIVDVVPGVASSMEGLDDDLCLCRIIEADP